MSDDLIGRRGAFVSRGGIRSGLENVQGLRTVTITYRLGLDTDDVEGEDGETVEGSRSRVVTRRVTVDFGQTKTPRDRELAIARTVQDHARAFKRDDSGVVIRISLVRVGEAIQLTPSKRPSRVVKPKRKPKAKPGAKVKAYRKAAGIARGKVTRKANALAKAKAKAKTERAQARAARKSAPAKAPSRKPSPKAKSKSKAKAKSPARKHK